MIEEVKVQNDIIYLVYCALNELSPEKKRVKEMNLQFIYKFCTKHSIVSLVYTALESLDLFHDQDMTESQIQMLREWKKEKDRVIFTNIHMDIERENIIQFMEQKGIWYVLLKGIILKELYPRTEMRQMGDNDILYDKTYQEDLYEFMLENGYEAKEYKESNHDMYIKKPLYNFEMHTSLFNDDNNAVWNNYYKNIMDRLIQDEDNDYGYHFKDEDFYIYFIIHMMKHFDEGGVGIRSMIDCYLYITKFNDKLDWKYIDSEFEALGIKAFEERMKAFSRKMFSDVKGLEDKELSADERALLKYMFYSGTYGSTQTKVIYNIAKITQSTGQMGKKEKFVYLWKRVFPGKEFMQKYHPVAYKYKVLIPFAYIKRIFQGLFQKKRRVYLQKELDTVLKNKTES